MSEKNKIIDENLSYEKNMTAAYIAYKKEDVIVSETTKLANDIINAKHEDADKKMDICSLIERMTQLKNILEIFVSIPQVFSEIVAYAAKECYKFLSQTLLKYIQILVLRIKKMISIIKKTVAEWTKIVLQWACTGKGSAVVTALISPFIVLYKALSFLAIGILIGIEKVLSFLPPMFVVPGEGMCFLMTPKSKNNTMMKVLNPSNSIVYWIPDPTITAINEAIKSNDKINLGIKISAISAGALLLSATIATGSTLKVPCEELSKLDSSTILNYIDKLLKLLIIPQPLPKFENLSPVNLGFLSWLITGFLPAGRLSFGFPG